MANFLLKFKTPSMRKVFSVTISKSIDIELEVGEFQLQVTTLFQVQSVPLLC